MTAPGPILVTGAGGFIGSTLATGLAALGHDVIALDQTFDAGAARRLGTIPRLTCDLAAGVPDLPRCDTIIHAAALTTNPAALGLTEAQHIAANTAPLMAMIAHADQTRPRTFVFLSSSGVFGDSDGSPDLTDTDLPTATGPYSAAKKAGEALVPGALGSWCQTHVLRLGYLFGPDEAPRPTRQRVSMLRQWLSDAAEGRPLTVAANDPRRDWTYAPDLAPAIARLIAGEGSARPLHLCTPDAQPDSALAALIAARHPGTRVISGAPSRPRRRCAPLPTPRSTGSAGPRWPKGSTTSSGAGRHDAPARHIGGPWRPVPHLAAGDRRRLPRADRGARRPRPRDPRRRRRRPTRHHHRPLPRRGRPKADAQAVILITPPPTAMRCSLRPLPPASPSSLKNRWPTASPPPRAMSRPPPPRTFP